MWVLEQNNKKQKSWGKFINSQHFKGRRVCWSYGMGLRQTHKWGFKMRSTRTTKKRKQLVQVEWKWWGEFSMDNLKHKLYMARTLWEKAPLPFPTIHYVPLHGNYIQMSFFPETPKQESQNWDSCCPGTLDAHIFFKSSLFWKFEENILKPSKRSFQTMYNIPQSELIWRLLSSGLWLKIKFPIWLLPLLLISTHANHFKWIMQGHFKHLHFKTFLMVS